MIALVDSHALMEARERLRASTPLNVRLTHIDGKLPNLALMKLAAFHRERGDSIYFTRNARRGLFEPDYDIVYGSTIFERSRPIVARLLADFPQAIVSGTGLHDASNKADRRWTLTVEDALGLPSYERLDYSIYDYVGFTASLGYTERGCRYRCRFCRVPDKEGPVRPVNTIAGIWRGDPYPRHIHLLDNDFFGQPEDAWQARIDEIVDGGFLVCFNQGINVRVMTPAIAKALARVPYRNDDFTVPRLYTAWDNIGDQRRFFDGISMLEAAGVPAEHIMAYMLIGFDVHETWERIFERFDAMRARGIRPYPMIYESAPGITGNGLDWKRLKDFQRWVIRKRYEFIAWEDYDGSARSRFKDHLRAKQLGLWPDT